MNTFILTLTVTSSPECRHLVVRTDTSNGRLLHDGPLNGPLQSGNPSALDDSNQKCDDGQDQQDMDEPAHGVGSNKPRSHKTSNIVKIVQSTLNSFIPS